MKKLLLIGIVLLTTGCDYEKQNAEKYKYCVENCPDGYSIRSWGMSEFGRIGYECYLDSDKEYKNTIRF